MTEEVHPQGKTHYIVLEGTAAYRKYFGSYREAKEWVDKNPIIIQGKKKGIYHIYPVDTSGMGGHKKGKSERLSYATKIGKQKRAEERKRWKR
jgi:hypothetical protein